MAAFARPFIAAFVRGFAGVLGRAGGGSLGPEAARDVKGGTWTLNLNGGAAGTVTQDANGIHFIGSANIASATGAPLSTLHDNAQVEVTFTVANYVNGGCRIIVSGQTTAHGFTGTTRNANGTYTERGYLTGASSSANLIRIQATGTSGNNNFDVTLLSVREVLQG